MGQVRERGYGHQRADFVLGEHDGHERRVAAYERPSFIHAHAAEGVHGESGHLDAMALQQLARPRGGGVLDRRGDDVPSPRRPLEDASDGEVVGLGAPGGEDDLVGLAGEERGDLLPGALNGGSSALTVDVSARRVAELLSR